MSKTTAIPFIEMSKFYHLAIHCPFCGKDPESEMRDGGKFAPCEHTLLMAHSEFWIYLSERAEKVLKAKRISVERSDLDVLFTKPDDEDVDYTGKMARSVYRKSRTTVLGGSISQPLSCRTKTGAPL